MRRIMKIIRFILFAIWIEFEANRATLKVHFTSFVTIYRKLFWITNSLSNELSQFRIIKATEEYNVLVNKGRKNMLSRQFKMRFILCFEQSFRETEA